MTTSADGTARAHGQLLRPAGVDVVPKIDRFPVYHRDHPEPSRSWGCARRIVRKRVGRQAPLRRQCKRIRLVFELERRSLGGESHDDEASFEDERRKTAILRDLSGERGAREPCERIDLRLRERCITRTAAKEGIPEIDDVAIDPCDHPRPSHARLLTGAATEVGRRRTRPAPYGERTNGLGLICNANRRTQAVDLQDDVGAVREGVERQFRPAVERFGNRSDAAGAKRFEGIVLVHR